MKTISRTSSEMLSIIEMLKPIDFFSMCCESNPDFQDNVLMYPDLVGSDVDFTPIKKEFNEIFFSEIMFHLKLKIQRCSHSHVCIKPECLAMSTLLWDESLKKLRNNLKSRENQKFLTFEYAYKMSKIFRDCLDGYMEQFREAQNCTTDSPIYKAKIEEIKTFIEERVSGNISRLSDEHDTSCAEDGYLPAAPSFFCCSCFVTRIEREWTNGLWFYQENEFNEYDSAFIDLENFDEFLSSYEDTKDFLLVTETDAKENLLCEDTEDFLLMTETDAKERRRDDFKKNTKGVLRDKRRYYRKKNIACN